MKKILISISVLICFIITPSYAAVNDEDGNLLSDVSDISTGDRLIMPDGSMYSVMDNNGQPTARLNEILPEIKADNENARMYRYASIGIYGINRRIDDVSKTLAPYGGVTLLEQKGLSEEESAYRLSYSGAALILGVKQTPGKEIRLTVLRTVSQRDAMLTARLAMKRGNISCLLIQDPPPGQKSSQPRLILEIGEKADAEKALKAANDIGYVLFNQAMKPDGSLRASAFIAPISLAVIFICFIWSFFRPRHTNNI